MDVGRGCPRRAARPMSSMRRWSICIGALRRGAFAPAFAWLLVRPSVRLVCTAAAEWRRLAVRCTISDARLREMGWRILLQVHDEVLMEVRRCQLPEPGTTHERASARPLVEYPTVPYMPSVPHSTALPPARSESPSGPVIALAAADAATHAATHAREPVTRGSPHAARLRRGPRRAWTRRCSS